MIKSGNLLILSTKIEYSLLFVGKSDNSWTPSSSWRSSMKAVTSTRSPSLSMRSPMCHSSQLAFLHLWFLKRRISLKSSDNSQKTMKSTVNFEIKRRTSLSCRFSIPNAKPANNLRIISTLAHKWTSKYPKKNSFTKSIWTSQQNENHIFDNPKTHKSCFYPILMLLLCQC